MLCTLLLQSDRCQPVGGELHVHTQFSQKMHALAVKSALPCSSLFLAGT